MSKHHFWRHFEKQKGVRCYPAWFTGLLVVVMVLLVCLGHVHVATRCLGVRRSCGVDFVPGQQGSGRIISDQDHPSPYTIHGVYYFKDRGARLHLYIATDYVQWVFEPCRCPIQPTPGPVCPLDVKHRASDRRRQQHKDNYNSNDHHRGVAGRAAAAAFIGACPALFQISSSVITFPKLYDCCIEEHS